MKRFCNQWCRTIVTGGSVGIRLMMTLDTTFKQKSLRQSDPLSPILFNIVADMLSILIKRAKNDGQIRGSKMDDTILFMDHDLKQAKNMKLLLCVFEQLLGLKINFHKSEIFCYGEAKIMSNNTLTYLAAIQGHTLFDT
ncbi:LOW QUALITY PROTEIN: hypothetical protein U9M48_040149 [Paspalum notatum var. saurae]|uniref:Reverse transcriptase domain-containing protein n=1 Tax=Paspalum notatum var. saurae TaxID=547442 RepID=A0AAQ3UM61_PASNO